MKDRIILTYVHKDGYDTFKWFSSIDDTVNFLFTDDITNNNVVKIIDCIRIKEYQEVKI